jgi:RNA polymerase-binding transcription factor DksA
MAPHPQPHRAQLVDRRAALRVRLAALESDLNRQGEPLSADFAEQAVEREHDEVLESLRLSIQSELDGIDRALARIDAGHYGVCLACGQGIEPQRLKSLPEAIRCARCAATQLMA